LRGSKGDAVDVFWTVTLCRLVNTDHGPEDDRRGVFGVSGAVRGLLDVRTAIGLLLVGATDCRRLKHEAFRVECNQGSRWQLDFRIEILLMLFYRIPSRDNILVFGQH